MTFDGYEVDTEALKRAGGGFDTNANTLQQILTTLNSALQAEGKCWGADETGQKFEEGYAEPSKSVLEAFPKLKTGLNGIKKGVDEMAKEYKKAEDASRLK
ncbi:WXG100 family type VII secretion target [Actinomadura sp. NTSP31]|uniref:WXG100 family type VII secretion target n=1 Tax=Actinomadura sp. NTSP31 TaxID=1735447 RepID=UPI0035C1466E